MTRAGMTGVAMVLGTTSGGTARYAGMLAEGCRRAGFGVMMLGPDSARPALLAGAAGLQKAAQDGPDGPEPRFLTLDIADRPRPRQDLAAVRRLRAVLRRAAPGIVHAHGMRAGAFAALALLAWRGGPALVVTVHNAPPDGRQARLVYGVLERICARRASRVICVSADLTGRMRRRGAASAVTLAAPALAAPAPEAGQVSAVRAEMSPNGVPVVLAVGRLAAQKGLDTLLAAATRWQHRQPPPRLVIAGEGPLAGELAATAARDGTDLVLLGQRSDVPALLAAADVVVVPSRWEGSALIVQEALRAGRPLVATRAGGNPALTGDDGAVLVRAGAVGALADAVAAVLDDPALAAGLSRGALVQAARLPDPEGTVQAVLAIYRELAGDVRTARCI
jgi:glycosyltransferase involved in cell wall biosynthesis